MKNLETIINTGEDQALFITTELVNHFVVFSPTHVQSEPIQKNSIL